MSDQSGIKIVIDTNIWISFLIGKKITSLKDAIYQKNVDIYSSDELLEELANVLKRPKQQKYFTEQDVTDLFVLLEDKIKRIKSSVKISECRDPKDNFILELAVSANADYLVTGDEDLLILNPFRNVRIVNPAEFENILSEKNNPV